MAAPKRLSKVARELNVGISTIVEFLADQGQDIDTSPNTKLEPAVYEMLLDEFQADRGAKEKAEEASRQKKEERKTITIDRAEEVVETVKVETPKPEKKIVKPSVVGKIDLDKVESSTRPVKKEVEPKVEPPAPKVEVKEVKVEPEKTPEVEEADKPIETIKVQKVKLSGPTVLGKIELPVEKEKPKKDNDAQKRKRKRIKKGL